jgi:hypothetical protein
LTIREVTEEAGIKKITRHEIPTESLGMHRVAAKYVSRLLSEVRKQNHVYISKGLVDHAYADERFVKKIVTGYET